MSFEYQTAKEGQVAGAPIFSGTDPDTADSASEEYGFLPDTSSPLKFDKDGWQIPAEWQMYPASLDQLSAQYRDFGPYNVYPDYQSIREALIAGAADNAIVIARGFWYGSWNNPIGGIVPVPGDGPFTRHEYTFIDYKTFPDGKERLIAQLSQGEAFGDRGCVYMDEETVNKAFARPSFNGLGCVIFRRGVQNNVVLTKIGYMQQLVMALGRLYDLLRGL